MKFNEGFLAQMREATKLLQTEGPAAATAAIQRALNGSADTGAAQSDPGTILPHGRRADATPPGGSANKRTKWPSGFSRADIEDVAFSDAPGPGKKDGEGAGRFLAASCTNHAGTRRYKLYIPAGYRDEPLPLVVMLHGCTQNPDDFAEGTRMNLLAEEGNFLVAYPEQNRTHNATQCWNWFQPEHQKRDRGEPSILADIVREISAGYRVDPRRVYIAGLSAGGAMAAVTAAEYPELFAAVGIHSGLPCGVARDMPSAFAAMKRSRAKAPAMKAKLHAAAPLTKAVPAIVFHGDRDATVHPDNAGQLMDQFTAGAGRAPLSTVTRREGTPGTHACTRTIVSDADGRAVGEKWIIHNAGHAWSGGSPNGSYTDPQGPCAAREMMRFFLQHGTGQA